MSFDLGFWHEDRSIRTSSALAIYRGLVAGQLELVQPHAAVGRFYEELRERHPGLGDAEVVDDCPWHAAHVATARHVLVSIRWPWVAALRPFLLELAARHGLVTFDPQIPVVIRARAPAQARLSTDQKQVVDDPGALVLAAEFQRLADPDQRGFLILERSPGHYLQTRRRRLGLFTLEFQDGSLERHFEYRRLLPAAEVLLYFQDYACGRFRSSPLVGWRRIDLRSAGNSRRNSNGAGEDAQRSG